MIQTVITLKTLKRPSNYRIMFASLYLTIKLYKISLLALRIQLTGAFGDWRHLPLQLMLTYLLNGLRLVFRPHWVPYSWNYSQFERIKNHLAVICCCAAPIRSASWALQNMEGNLYHFWPSATASEVGPNGASSIFDTI